MLDIVQHLGIKKFIVILSESLYNFIPERNINVAFAWLLLKFGVLEETPVMICRVLNAFLRWELSETKMSISSTNCVGANMGQLRLLALPEAKGTKEYWLHYCGTGRG